MHVLRHVVSGTCLALLLAACGGSPPRPVLPEPAATARSMNELGLESFHAGRYREAIAGFEAAEREFRSIDDPRGVAVAGISQAETWLLLGERNRARHALDRVRSVPAAAVDEGIGERVRLLEARLLLEENPAGARQALESLASATPGVAQAAELLLCQLHIDAGEPECAAGLESDDALVRARIAQLRADAAFRRDEPIAANDHLEQALATYRSLAYRPGIAAVHESLAAAATRRGDTPAAISHLERTLYLRAWIRDRVHAMETLAQLAAVAVNAEERERYRNWRAVLQDESREPDWTAMMDALFDAP